MLIDDLLEKTSRTFAMSIPMLPEPTRQAVAVAYLLFRIADTFEDSTAWPTSARLAALADFVRLLERPEIPRAHALGAQWVAARPCEVQGYLDLLAATGAVFEALAAMAPEAQSIVTRHAVRTAQGMADFVARPTERNALEITSLPELRRYCYVVAGIVGELLTELFLWADPSLAAGEAAAGLASRAVAFGEGLQLVNILKDAGADAAERRSFVPPGTERAALFALARADLAEARAYVRVLEIARADSGFVAFTALPVLLAAEALDAVETRGPGAKVPRARVMSVASEMMERIARGASVFV